MIVQPKAGILGRLLRQRAQHGLQIVRNHKQRAYDVHGRRAVGGKIVQQRLHMVGCAAQQGKGIALEAGAIGMNQHLVRRQRFGAAGDAVVIIQRHKAELIHLAEAADAVGTVGRGMQVNRAVFQRP